MWFGMFSSSAGGDRKESTGEGLREGQERWNKGMEMETGHQQAGRAENEAGGVRWEEGNRGEEMARVRG